MTILKIAPALFLAFLLSACGDMNKRAVGENNKSFSAISADGLVVDQGTVRFNDAEGGHFVIDSDTGETFLPTQLAQDFQVDGMRVSFQGRLAKDSYMTQMSGRLLQIESIDVIE